MSYPRTVRRRLAILASLALMAAACSEEGPPADPYADGVRAARAADPSAAAEAYRAAIEASPRDDRAWAGLTRAQLRLGVDATESARRLAALAPGSNDARELLGLALLASGDAEGARPALERAYATDPRRHRLCFPLARARERTGRGTPLHYRRCADRGVDVAPSLVAATRLSLDRLGDAATPHAVSVTLARLAPDLDRAEQAATNDQVRQAIAAQRSRIARLRAGVGGPVTLDAVRAQAAALGASAPACPPAP